MEVIAWLLHPKPELRATVYDMERDPWVQQPICIEEYCWTNVLPNCGRSLECRLANTGLDCPTVVELMNVNILVQGSA